MPATDPRTAGGDSRGLQRFVRQDPRMPRHVRGRARAREQLLGGGIDLDQLDVGHFDVDMAWDSALVAEGGCTVVGIAGVAHGDGL